MSRSISYAATNLYCTNSATAFPKSLLALQVFLFLTLYGPLIWPSVEGVQPIQNLLTSDLLLFTISHRRLLYRTVKHILPDSYISYSFAEMPTG